MSCASGKSAQQSATADPKNAGAFSGWLSPGVGYSQYSSAMQTAERLINRRALPQGACGSWYRHSAIHRQLGGIGAACFLPSPVPNKSLQPTANPLRGLAVG